MSVRYGLLGLAMVLMLADLYLISMVAPTDSVLGHVQRIFYFHVPIAVISFLAFFLVFLASVVYLVRRTPVWDPDRPLLSRGWSGVRHAGLADRRHLGAAGVEHVVDVGTPPDHNVDSLVDLRCVLDDQVLRTQPPKRSAVCRSGRYRGIR